MRTQSWVTENLSVTTISVKFSFFIFFITQKYVSYFITLRQYLLILQTILTGCPGTKRVGCTLGPFFRESAEEEEVEEGEEAEDCKSLAAMVFFTLRAEGLTAASWWTHSLTSWLTSRRRGLQHTGSAYNHDHHNNIQGHHIIVSKQSVYSPDRTVCNNS